MSFAATQSGLLDFAAGGLSTQAAAKHVSCVDVKQVRTGSYVATEATTAVAAG